MLFLIYWFHSIIYIYILVNLIIYEENLEETDECMFNQGYKLDN